MISKASPSDDFDQVSTLTVEDFARARPATEMFSKAAIETFRNRGGRPKADNPKVQVSLRLDKDLLDVLEARDDWRSFVNNTMREAVFKG